jgi:hypothetical protein
MPGADCVAAELIENALTASHGDCPGTHIVTDEETVVDAPYSTFTSSVLTSETTVVSGTESVKLVEVIE